MSFSLSTSWNAFRHTTAKDIIREIQEAGFDEIELSFNLTELLVREIEGLVADQEIKVSSVHNFCPIPDGLTVKDALPDCFSMASLDEDERCLCVKYTKRSIDTALSLNAKAVVLHCGRVEIPDKTRQLVTLYRQGLTNSAEFKNLRNDAIVQREAASKPFFENTLRSLEELAAYADKKGIALGIETRFYYREIPALKEIGMLLDKLSGSNVFYWHDIGHAQLMENLGFLNHKDLLRTYGSTLLGVHLHDISNCLDHHAPGKGEMDFSILKPYLTPETIKVMEVHHPETMDDLIRAREFLEEIFHEKK